ncbi:MAG TPA: hypothetical protein VFN53_11210 [Acidobacteriaceae bacterium]|nr:hypothetical protein [Acidobacteriaceae bacterium]
MGLDIRLPVGMLFVITGGMMTVYGLFTRGSAIYEKSLYLNVNLIWGLILFLFGLLLLLLAGTARGTKPPADGKPGPGEPHQRVPHSH